MRYRAAIAMALAAGCLGLTACGSARPQGHRAAAAAASSTQATAPTPAPAPSQTVASTSSTPEEPDAPPPADDSTPSTAKVAPPPQPVSEGRPAVPPSTLPVPQPPYAPGEPHPLSGRPPDGTVRTAVAASGQPAQPNGPFAVDGGWQVTATLQVWGGHLTGTGWPAVLTITDGTGKLYLLNADGAPGPAFVRGVKGDWVLIQQGLGYQVFNFKTGAVDRSDQSANPGATTKLY